MDEAADAGERLLRGRRGRGVRVRSPATDRGFHSVDVIRRVNGMGMPIVMPAVKISRIKERTRESDAGGRGAASEHATASASGGTAPCKLVIAGRRNRAKGATKEAKRPSKPREKEASVAYKHHAFAAAMPDSRIGNNPRKAAEFCRVRRGMENPHKSYVQMRQNDRPQPLRPAPAGHGAVHILQHVVAAPLHGGAPRGRPQRGGRSPAAVHAGHLHGHDGGRGGRAAGHARRASAGLGAPRYVKPIRAIPAARRSVARAGHHGAGRPSIRPRRIVTPGRVRTDLAFAGGCLLCRSLGRSVVR